MRSCAFQVFFVSLLSACIVGCGGSENSHAPGGDSSSQTLYEPTRESLEQHEVPQWYQDAKFGIFIHWGPASVPAYAPVSKAQPVGGFPYAITANYAFWYWMNASVPGSPQNLHHLATYGAEYPYDNFITEFKADKFDPYEWLSLFEEAGARYFLLVAKHHDGFALWPTETTNRNSVIMGPKRDIVGEMFAAARADFPGIKPAVYLSIPEWFNPAPNPSLSLTSPEIATNSFFWGREAENPGTHVPVEYTGYKPVDDYAQDVLLPQLHELIDNYQPAIIWCDIGGDGEYFQVNQWMADYYNQVPDGLVNDRCGTNSHRDFHTPENGLQRDLTPSKWESSRGMAFAYGFNQQEEDEDIYETGEYFIAVLVDIVSKNGNLALNVGPKADGTISEKQALRLREIGAWLKLHGEGIYASRPWTHPEDGETAPCTIPGVAGADVNTALGGEVCSYPIAKPTGLRFTVGADGSFYIFSMEWPGDEMIVNSEIPTHAGQRITLLSGNGEELEWFHDAEGRLHVILPPEPSDGDEQPVYGFKISAG